MLTYVILRQVVHYIEDGWPSNVDNTELKQFFYRKESLSLIEGCILFGSRVVVPKIYRQRVLKQFHKGHPGKERMKSLARSFIYWPYLDQEMNDYVHKCGACLQASKQPVKAELSSWPIPEEQWERVHIDFAGPISGASYLIIVDAFSKWPEIEQMKSTSSLSVVKKLEKIFATFGNPRTLVSDKATNFTSSVFNEFCNKNGIQHICTPVYHPQSNGQAERFVDTFKRALKKSKNMSLNDNFSTNI